MQFSHNLIFVEDYPQEGEHVLYNTRTQGMVKISQELREAVENYEITPGSVIEKHRNDLYELWQLGFVAKDEAEDQERLKDFMNQIKYGVDDSCYTVTLLTTYACNFKCTYCFEESSRVNVKMDWETCEQAMNFLKEKLIKFGYRT